jgi:membrane protease YdiL (CAAX protease family)
MKQFFKLIFINREGQVRSGWKVGLILTGYGLGMWIWQTFYPAGKFADLRYNLADTLIFGVIIFLVLRWIDRKKFKDIGFTNLFRHFGDLGFGLMLGAVSMTAIFVLLSASGQIVVQRVDLAHDILTSAGDGLLLFALVGLREELFSRGYCLYAFRQMRHEWLAVLLSSVLFTLLHSINPNLQFIGTLNIFLAGLLFSFMAIKTGNLWMAIGFHITWNYFQGSIFGFPVSGIWINGLYQTEIRYDNLLTGGPFGPEGGLLTTGILFTGFVIVWLYTRQRKNTLRPTIQPSLEPLPAIEKPEKHEEYC